MITRTTSRTLAVCLAAGLCVSARGAPANDPDDLPITQITLYRSGVGSFVRTGEVVGDSDVNLRFRTDQVNDILKSMVVLDLDGGRVEGATYGSKEPLSRRLGSFAVNIADNPSRAQLLERLRGAPIRVRTAEGEREGPVLGVERSQSVTPEGMSVTREVVTLMTGNGLWSADVDAVLSFEILDEALANELNKALIALAEHRADNVKTLDLAFRGSGERDVMVRYVHEAPVWKTSYRLVLPNDGSDRLTLQGWAIVENTTEEDWEGVRLSLVSGQPVSFVMDLYEPVFVARPEVPVPTGAGARPRSYAGGQSPGEGGWDDDAGADARGRRAFAAAADRMETESLARADNFGRPALKALGEVMAGSVAAAASGEDVGEVFQFSLDAPVTVGRQQSAMLPIIAGDIEGRRVSIFNLADGIGHPMRGVEVENDTGLQLMPGPISVYDSQAYAGDAQIGHVSRGDERLLAYAVDLDVDARAENSGTTTVQRLRIVKGLLQMQTVDRQGVTYRFESNDGRRGRTMIIEHGKFSGWDLVESPEPSEVTDDLYRFEVEMDAGGKRELSVTQQRTRYDSVQLLNFDLNTLLSYSRNGKVSDDVVAAFREAQRLRALVSDAERRLAELEKERTDIGNDQDRIRRNMGSIDRTSDLYSRYMQKLAEQETRLEEIVELIEATTDERTSRQAALDAYLRDLNVE